jgi:hypothetical protein
MEEKDNEEDNAITYSLPNIGGVLPLSEEALC